MRASEIAGDKGWLVGTSVGGFSAPDLIGISFLDRTDQRSPAQKAFNFDDAGRILSENLHMGFGSTADMYSINDEKINDAANHFFGIHLSNAIAQASGGKVKSADVADLCEALKHGTGASQIEISQKLQDLGVTPDMMHSALVHMADAFDGKTYESPFSARNIRAKQNGDSFA
jgi:hypothetical protein